MFFGPQMDSSNQDQESQVKMVRNFVVGESVGVVQFSHFSLQQIKIIRVLIWS